MESNAFKQFPPLRHHRLFSMSLSKTVFASAYLSLALLPGTYAVAQGAGPVFISGLNEIEYDETSNLAEGDTVDIYDDPVLRERCMDVGSIEPDTAGSTEALLKFYLVTDYNDLEEKMGAKLSASLASEASFASLLNAKTSLDVGGSYSDFVKNTDQSVMLVLEASALYGRNIIREIGLKPEFRELQKDDPDEFRRLCGTHFIRGVRKEARIRVVYNFSSLSTTAKNTITGQFKSGYEAGVKLSEIGGKAKSEISASFERTVNMANRLGRASVEVQTVGGEGISTVGKALAGSALNDTSQVSSLIQGLVDASSTFSNQNAAPIAFILAQHATVFPDQGNSRTVDFSVLERFHHALLRVDSLRAQYESYRQRNPDIWNKYFKVRSEEADALRAKVLDLLRSCRIEAQCDLDTLNGLSISGLSLDDVLIDGSLSGLCNYRNVLPTTPGGSELATLSSVQIEWAGKAQFLDSVDIMGTEIFRLDGDLQVVDVPFNFGQFGRMDQNEQEEQRRVFMALEALSVPEHAVSNGVMDLDELLAFRNDVAQMLYVARVYFRNGLSSEIPLGQPDLAGCDLVDE